VEYGLAYLDQQGVLATLENMMRSSEADPLAGFLIPGIVLLSLSSQLSLSALFFYFFLFLQIKYKSFLIICPWLSG
jgi:hypothetical protein